MSARPTPGPWAEPYDDELDGVPFLVIETDQPTGPKLRNICEVSATYTDDDCFVIDDEVRANARLIAAAPELLEACERIKAEKAPSYHDCIDNGEPECAWCAVFNALAKARGEQA